jgi:Uma2 family endonuclease
MVTNQRLYTVDEFEAFISQPEHRKYAYELINGEIREKVVTGSHSAIAANIATLINVYLWQNQLPGWIGVEGRFRPVGTTHDDRLPDVHYVSDPNNYLIEKGAMPFTPDLAVEIKSPNDTYIEMSETAAFYLQYGAKIVWLVYPEKRLVEVLTITERHLLSEDEQLTSGDVLPGLAIAVRDVFRSIKQNG